MVGRFTAALWLSLALCACSSRALRPQPGAFNPTVDASGFDGGEPTNTFQGEDAPAKLPEMADSGPPDAAAATIRDSGAVPDAAADTRRDGWPATGKDSCPPQGESCSFGLDCTWGEPVEVACRWYTDCYHTWMPEYRNRNLCSTDLHKPGCPDSPPASGTACPFQQQVCAYPNGPDCECDTDSSTGAADARPDQSLPGLWRCADRQNPAACPAIAPYLYSSCSASPNQILFCNYAYFNYQCTPSSNRWTGDW
jgi:hypothetical protein